MEIWCAWGKVAGEENDGGYGFGRREFFVRVIVGYGIGV